MKKDSLAYFSEPKDYQIFIDNLNIYNGWKMSKGIMNSRGELIRNKCYANQLRKMFSDKKAFRREVSISEIVSWLDSFVIMTRVVEELKTSISKEEYENVEIYFEYIIKMSKKMRVDFIIKYKKVILLLEMRMVDNFRKIKGTWAKKKGELLIYKELMNNYIEDDNKILTFAFISLYEFNNRKEDFSHSHYNNNQVKFLVKYIQKFMIK